MGSRWQLLLPDAVKVWQGTELFISSDQRPATVKCRGRDQAISWIAMLKHGAAGENSNVRGDGQDIEPQSLKKTGEIFNSWHIIRKPKTTAFMQKGDLPKGNIGNGELAILPAFSRAAAALLLSREGALAQNRGMWVSQMICIATPFEIRNGAHHVTQGNAIPKSEQPLACLLSGVTLWLDARDDPSTGCDLQLLAGLNSPEESGKVLPQVGYGDSSHAGWLSPYKYSVQQQDHACLP
jgi:hypothetical protein